MDNTLIDLALESNGGRTLLASDDFFAPKENLLKPGRGVFIEDKYTDHLILKRDQSMYYPLLFKIIFPVGFPKNSPFSYTFCPRRKVAFTTP